MANEEPNENSIPDGVEINPRHAEAGPHHFEFDLDRGIRDQAVEKLEASPLLPLRKGVGPTESGIYTLYFKKELVYIGMACKDKTTSKRTLRDRLGEHIHNCAKKGVSLEDMDCRYLTLVSDWWVFAAEFALIAHYNPKWNGSGWGSKTPGKGRPGTGKISKWEKEFGKA